jgi:protocatechuate 3,4-dioxygenase beta subunit
MDRHRTRQATRRRLVGAASSLPLAGRFGAGVARLGTSAPLAGVLASAYTGSSMAATPACIDHGEPTESQTAGPYYTPNSPRRDSLREKGMAGTRLVLAGRVMSTDCRMLRRALLDFWHADARGRYDNEGYRLRGHLYTDDEGRYRLETILPGIYPGRTRHIHVKARPGGGGPLLTTQLYFPGEVRNAGDSIFSPQLLVTVDASGSEPRGDGDAEPPMSVSFDFVLAT